MRIDNRGGTPDAADAGNVASQSVSQVAPSSATAQSSSSNTTKDSTYQSKLTALVAQINQLPEIRQEKVTALAQQIQRGNYDVSPEQTAIALLDELTSHQAA